MEALQQEHTNSQYANLGFACWGVFGSDEHKTTAKVEWTYVATGKAKQVGKREEGRNGWGLGDFMACNGKNCVKLIATQETGRLAHTPTDGEGKNGFRAGRRYTVYLHAKVKAEGDGSGEGGEGGGGGGGGEGGGKGKGGDVESVGILVDGSDLVWNNAVFRAGLTEEETIVGRLYTGPMYVWYNHILRYLEQPTPKDDAFLRKGESWGKWKTAQVYPSHWLAENGGESADLFKIPFTTTLHVLNSFILKLSRTQRALKVYRGIKGGVLPEQFWKANEHGVKGGIELAFMSTTLDRAVAMKFAKAEKGPSIVFEIQMGMVDRGADVQWCSQFPCEAEILFAPLTGLEVVGSPTVEGQVIVVELRLNCNLHDLTIEQILSKMQKVKGPDCVCVCVEFACVFVLQMRLSVGPSCCTCVSVCSWACNYAPINRFVHPD
jgi:hypothetical protein